MKIAIKFSFMILVLGLALTSCKKKAGGDKAKVGEAVGKAAAAANSVSYAINPGSKIYWTGSKPAGSHSGTIDIVKGKLDASNNDISGGQFMIDMKTLAVTDLKAGEGKEDLEGHLKGSAEENADHFFNVATYPEAIFTITSVAKGTDGKNSHVITGDLTMKGKTKSVSFPANVVIAGDKINATAPAFKINRTDWGINYGSKSVFDDLKNKFINDDISLNIDMTATKM